MTTDLMNRECVPCEGETPPLTRVEAEQLLANLDPSWKIVDGVKIRREFLFKNFVRAMGFVDRVADVAESEGHHPDIHIFYHRVVLELTTHAIHGLSENDFIVAAKIEPMIALGSRDIS